jgi:hypothetical protein
MRLTNKAFSCAIRQRIGLPSHDHAASGCHCEAEHAQPQNEHFDSRHALSCQHQLHGEVTGRHNRVVNILAKWANHLGWSSQKEAMLSMQRRADLRLTDPDGQDYLIDVTFASPTCPSSIERAHSDTEVLGAATKAAQRKRAQYRNLIEGGEKFVPFALEVDGGMHDEAINFVKRLARSAYDNDNCPLSSAEVRTAIVSEIAIATQIGNFRTFRRNLNNNIRAGLVVRSAQAHSHELDDDDGTFFGDDRDAPPQHPRAAASPHTPERKEDYQHRHSSSPLNDSSLSTLVLPEDQHLHSFPGLVLPEDPQQQAQALAEADGLTEPDDHTCTGSEHAEAEDPSAEFDRLARADPTVHAIVAVNPQLQGALPDHQLSQLRAPSLAARSRSPSVLSYSTEAEQEGSQRTLQAHLQQHKARSSSKSHASRKSTSSTARASEAGSINTEEAAAETQATAAEDDESDALAALFSALAGTDSDSGAQGNASDKPHRSA